MTCCTIVYGGSASRREATIGTLIDAVVYTEIPEGIEATRRSDSASTTSIAVIIEGNVCPGSRFASAADGRASDGDARTIRIIAAGCPCCNDGLVMRVTLDRILRKRPSFLYIALIDEGHNDHLRQFLAEPPYASWLDLADSVFCGAE